MNVAIAFQDRISGNEEFSSKSRSEQFELVIESLKNNKGDIENLPTTFENEVLLPIYNKTNRDEISLDEFHQFYEYHNLTDILNILMPSSKHAFWSDTSESDCDELASVYVRIWAKMLKTIGVKDVSSISSDYDEANESAGITISFTLDNEKYSYNYSIPDHDLDVMIFNDFDKFCQKINVDSVFLVDEFIGDEHIGGYILPKQSAIELAKYFPVEY